MKKSELNQTAQKDGIERRSRLFYTVGSCFVAMILVLFGLFLARHYVQNIRWAKHYYKDARVFANDCTARFARSDDQFPSILEPMPFKAVAAVPHARGFFSKWLPENASGRFYHLEYRCVVSTDGIRIARGVNYMHLGWIFGEDIRVNVNYRELLHIKGEDFVSFPIAHSDLSVPELVVEIKITSTDGHRIGLVSILPPAISTDTKTHTNLLGIQPIFELSNGIVPLVPSLCLGLLLGFAWIVGVRTRIVFTGMFYITVKTLDISLPQLAPYLPLAATKVHSLGVALDLLADSAVFCILLEVFGVWRTRIYSIMNLSVAISLVGVGTILSWEGVFPYAGEVANIRNTVMGPLCLCIIAAGWRARSQTNNHQKKRLMSAALLFGVAFLWRYINELSRYYGWGFHFNISFYFNFLLPLYLTGVVFYHLSAVELQLRQVVREREIMKNRLQVGADLLSVVQANGVSCQRVAAIEMEWTTGRPANLWTYAWEGSGGMALLALGRIMGGDEHIALGTAAISALLLQWKDQGRSDCVECLEQINHMLLSTFRGYVRSSISIVSITGSHLDLWSAGADVDTPVLIIGDRRYDVLSNNQLAGTANILQIEHTKVDRLGQSKISIVMENDGAALLVSQSSAA